MWLQLSAAGHHSFMPYRLITRSTGYRCSMEFIETLRKHGCYPLRASKIETLQVNVGYRCNMSCKHCHVQAGPSREELMGLDTIKSVITVLAGSDIRQLDITGGAPEFNP